MQRRTIGVFCAIALLMTLCIYRVYYINMSDYLATAAEVQGKYVLKIARTRGTVYDRNLQSLVNNEYKFVASVMPTPQAASALVELADDGERPALVELLSAGNPFAMEVENGDIYAQGVDVFRVPQRYGAVQYAPHLVGYLGSDGQSGAAGIEKGYDQWLKANGGSIEMVYQVDATGRAFQGAAAGVSREGGDALGGVVLSLDSGIQLITQNALQNGCEKGAAVVMDVYTGDILAMASIPVFDQNDIAASLESEDAPFVNRAVSGYNIGSVFKLIVTAAALEQGISQDYHYECPGYIDVNGQIFRCNNDAVHGDLDLPRALQVSCNGYFIRLAQEMEPEYVLTLASNLGLGSTAELAEGITAQAGNLPTAQELSNEAAYANFSFGQGSSLASPLQMAQAISAIANSGYSVYPRLIQGFTEDGATIPEVNPIYTTNQVLGQRTCVQLQELMVKVIDEGSGKPGRPLTGGAGGKTSSAQTGQTAVDEDGEEKEIVHAWFGGFYPAENPRYSIVVFVEGGESGEQVAAPIFKQIADGIVGLQQSADTPGLGYSR